MVKLFPRKQGNNCPGYYAEGAADAAMTKTSRRKSFTIWDSFAPTALNNADFPCSRRWHSRKYSPHKNAEE